MMKTWVSLLNSRKFWVGTFSVIGVFVATLLRALNKIPADALLPTIASIAGLGSAFIVSTGIEDASKKSGASRVFDIGNVEWDENESEKESVEEPSWEKGSVEEELTSWQTTLDLPHYVDLCLFSDVKGKPISTIEWRNGEEPFGEALKEALRVARGYVKTENEGKPVDFTLRLEGFVRDKKIKEFDKVFTLPKPV